MKSALPAASLAALLVAPWIQAQEDQEGQNAAYTKTDGYPLDTCIVAGKDCREPGTIAEIEGRTYKACSAECVAKIEKDQARFAKALDDAVVAAQRPSYPLDTCVISGKRLGSMGEPKPVVVGGHLVLLCCGSCTKKLHAQKDKVIAKLTTAAYEKQSAAFAGKTCPVSGDPFDHADAVDMMHGYTLIRLCCEDCIEKVHKTPNAIAAKVGEAGKPEKSEHAGHERGKEHKDGHEHGKGDSPPPRRP